MTHVIIWAAFLLITAFIYSGWADKLHNRVVKGVIYYAWQASVFFALLSAVAGVFRLVVHLAGY